jgi:hypothetical protein
MCYTFDKPQISKPNTMKTTTLAKKITFLFTCLGIGIAVNAQNNVKEEPKIVIERIEIMNGDTSIEKTVLVGEDAKRYKEEHHALHFTEKKEGRNVVVDIDELVEEEIELSSNKTTKENNVIVKTVVCDKNQGEAPHIEIEEDRILIENEDGSLQTIELKNDDLTARHIVIIKEIENVENEDPQTKGGAISAAESNGDIKVFPNPNDGTFTIETTLKNKGTATIQVADINGKILLTDQLSGKGVQKKQIDLHTFGKGVFFIQVEQEGEVLSRKVIVD